MKPEGRYEKGNKFWEIIYYLDTNEILTRTGIKGTVGRLYINYGFGDNYENIIKKKTNKKLSEGWKHISNKINQEFNEDTLMDYRLDNFDYEGKKKIKNKKTKKKSKKK
mgnify:CR=1 FL=1